MKQLVIFDLDGTLVNTIDDLAQASNYALRKCGFAEHPVEAYTSMVGNGVQRLLERALPEEMRNQETLDMMRRFFSEYYDVHCTDLSRPYPGISELLADLTAEGIKVAVASNKYQSAVDRIVRHYFGEIPWAAIEGQKPGVPIKPDPSVVFEILGIVPTPKAKVLYVGDSGVDMVTAQRACVDSVGVTWGFRSEDELREHYAGNIVYDPVEIFNLAMRRDDY